MMRLHQSIAIKCSGDKLYRTLLSADEFAKVTGASAQIAQEEGGAFSCFGGMITGRHIVLTPNEQIIQAWRVGTWPDGQFSIVKFDIAGSDKTATIELEHSAFPEGEDDHLDGGWHKMYWEPLKSYLEQ